MLAICLPSCFPSCFRRAGERVRVQDPVRCGAVCRVDYYTLFSDVINRAPQLVLGNVNYVKKVVFPLEILPVVQLLSATFHALVSVVVLIAAQLVFQGSLPITALLLPVVLLPFLLLTLGLAWCLASLEGFLCAMWGRPSA